MIDRLLEYRYAQQGDDVSMRFWLMEVMTGNHVLTPFLKDLNFLSPWACSFLNSNLPKFLIHIYFCEKSLLPD